MKIIHTGDVHLGSAFQNLSKEKSRLRRVELIDGFTRLCAYAKESGVSAVLIAGDLFDGNNTAAYVKKQALSAIAAANPVRFFYASGNHDDEFQEEELPSNLFLFSRNHAWQSYALGEGITVCGMDTKNMTAQTLAALALQADEFNLTVLHGDIGGNGKEAIDLRLLQNKGIDYLALGHIHKPDLERLRLDARTSYRYCGALEGRGFDEIGSRGFFLLDIVDKRIVMEKFLSFATRTVREVRVDISACESYFDLESAVLNALAKISTNDIVKIVLCGVVSPCLRKDQALLSKRLSGRLFHVKIVDETKMRFRAEDFANDATERGEFVKEVGRYAMNEKQRAEILEIGLKALAGEEIDL